MFVPAVSIPSNAEAHLAFLKALGNAHRLQIVEWLKAPTDHFPAQVDGDLVYDGVCLGAIVRKLDLAQPTVTNHMRVLADAGLVRSSRIKNWHFFQLDKVTLEQGLKALSKHLGH